MSAVIAIIFVMVIAALFVSLVVYGSKHPMVRFDERFENRVV